MFVTSTLEQKLTTIDELSKAYQRIVSCSDKSEVNDSTITDTEKTILNKIKDVVESIEKK